MVILIARRVCVIYIRRIYDSFVLYSVITVKVGCGHNVVERKIR